MAEEEDKHLASLETGDEFEDFPVEKWTATPADGDTNLWEEQWEDDDNLDDDFSVQLKAEIAKREKQ